LSLGFFSQVEKTTMSQEAHCCFLVFFLGVKDNDEMGSQIVTILGCFPLVA
jgi:hypothetical protein